MKHAALVFFIFSLSLIISSCSPSKKSVNSSYQKYEPSSKELYNTILLQDSVFFDAYNNCDMIKQAEYYSDDIEFFHDQAGLISSKQIILDATKQNICGKVKRNLIKETLEVYPINNYGAIEIGYQLFENISEGKAEISKPSKFIMIWQNKDNKWKITKVVSLH